MWLGGKCREANGESRTLAFNADKRNASSMQLHAPFHDGEAKTGTGDIPDVDAAVEGLEQLFLVGHGNTDARVAHLHDGNLSFTAQVQVDGRPSGRLLHRAVEKIGKHDSGQRVIQAGMPSQTIPR